MGRYSDIKKYDTHGLYQPLTLFDTGAQRAAVVQRLIASQWVFLGRELVSNEAVDAGVGLTHQMCEEIEVTYDERKDVPWLFRRRRNSGKRIELYVVSDMLERWVVDWGWWDDGVRQSNRFYRVACAQGIFELSFNQLSKQWLLVGILD